ncbi:MAG: sulfite exporter TauE/SafE family protein [Candidatus Eisenbacteria sp.]|nr:sulfite exporter TauE/SafE family protein [Candidatus Eisenbacteria bacterium]
MASQRILKTVWTLCLIGLGVALIFLTFSPDIRLAERFGGATLFLIIGVLAFFAEYVDSSLGMGYGTTLTPMLMIFGFSPLQVVPAVLLSEFISGITSGALHHRTGNVDLGRGTRARRTMQILVACSVVGTVAAVLLAVSLPKPIVKGYIGFMILGIGFFIIYGRRLMGRFSWGKIIGVGTIAAFNKGISGGGYGPVVTGGQILSGVGEKSAIGITSFAEGLVCLVGLILYLVLQGGVAWGLALPLMLGAILSVPAAVWTVKIMPERLLRRSIGYATLFLGVLTLIRVVL